MVARPLAHAVLAGLLHAVDHPYRDLLERRPALPRPASVREAVELLENAPEHPWTVPELARRVGVSTRGLQDGFARHVGQSPTAYLRVMRLRRCHDRADHRLAPPEWLAAAVELGELLTGSHPGRTDDRQVAVYKSVGVGIQDAAVAAVVHGRLEGG